MSTVLGSAYHDNNTVNGVPAVYRPILEGTATTDNIYGYGGDDHIEGYGGNDSLFGGIGNDLAYGGNDHDIIYGNAGSDRLAGNAGNDSLYGGTENDLLYGGAGTDALYGESGNDFLSGETGSDSLYGGSGNDELYGYGYGSSEYDTVTGGLGADKFILGDRFLSFYSGLGYACIVDFKWDEGDKIQVQGSLSDYRINKTENWYGSADLDTAIYKGSELIGVVADRRDVFLALDFIAV